MIKKQFWPYLTINLAHCAAARHPAKLRATKLACMPVIKVNYDLACLLLCEVAAAGFWQNVLRSGEITPTPQTPGIATGGFIDLCSTDLHKNAALCYDNWAHLGI